MFFTDTFSIIEDNYCCITEYIELIFCDVIFHFTFIIYTY